MAIWKQITPADRMVYTTAALRVIRNGHLQKSFVV